VPYLIVGSREEQHLAVLAQVLVNPGKTANYNYKLKRLINKNESYYLMAIINCITQLRYFFAWTRGLPRNGVSHNGLPHKGFNAGLWIRITFMRNRTQRFPLMWIRILSLIKVMGVCDFWSIDARAPF
jgi:hypothetical protein